MNLRLRRWRRRLLVMLAALLALAGVGYRVLAASTSRSQVARAVIWGESDVRDYARFPARRVAARPTRFSFRRPPGGSSVPPVRTVTVLEGGLPVQRDLGVVTREVVNAADWWAAAEGGVGSVMVVPMDPRLQGPVAGGVGAIQPPIRPLLQQGAVEPLHLPIGLRPIGPGAPMPDAG